jgi:exosortase
MLAYLSGMRLSSRALVIVSAAALLTCFAPVIAGMANQWLTDEDMGHGFLVPIVIGWIVWRERNTWRGLPAKPSSPGFGFLGLGLMMHLISALGTGLFAGSVGFILSLMGVILCLGGIAWLKAWAFPLGLTVFMLPKLAIVYNQTTLPLQLLATRLAAGMLSLAGFSVIRNGNILDVSGHQISVVAACSGIRYLLPLAFLAVVFAYAVDSKPWMPAALVAAAIPVAIIANAVRVASAASWPALVEGTPHAIAGWLIFMFCIPALAGFRYLVNSVYARLYV